jgi:hypothetical protein
VSGHHETTTSKRYAEKLHKLDEVQEYADGTGTLSDSKVRFFRKGNGLPLTLEQQKTPYLFSSVLMCRGTIGRNLMLLYDSLNSRAMKKKTRNWIRVFWFEKRKIELIATLFLD